MIVGVEGPKLEGVKCDCRMGGGEIMKGVHFVLALIVIEDSSQGGGGGILCVGEEFGAGVKRFYGASKSRIMTSSAENRLREV